MKTDREKRIVRTSVVGIFANVVLVIFKMGVGLLANSIAIILDAVNNLSDALSSVITIVGTKLAGKKPDKKHPYGYGRIEYITSTIIAVIVLLAGVTSIRESIAKIITPDETDYSIVSLVIIAVAVLVKIFVGRYVKSVGTQINSGSLIASGSDALFDAVLSTTTLIGAAINLIWGLNLEGILGTLISVFIIKAGIEMLIETLNSIIGTRADKELTDKLKETVLSYEEVKGAYDLILHNYGPTKELATVHIEVDDTMTAREIHALTRRIQTDVMQKFGIILTVGIYASNTSGKYAEIRETIEKTVKDYKDILQYHGLYVDDENNLITFDIIVDFDADAAKIRNELTEKICGKLHGYNVAIVLDSDFTD